MYDGAEGGREKEMKGGREETLAGTEAVRKKRGPERCLVSFFSSLPLNPLSLLISPGHVLCILRNYLAKVLLLKASSHSRLPVKSLRTLNISSARVVHVSPQDVTTSRGPPDDPHTHTHTHPHTHTHTHTLHVQQ